MERYPGYESMLTRVEHMKMQVKAQLPTEYSQTVDNMVDFVLDEVNQCCDVATVDATTDTTEDHLLSGGPVARADDTRIDVNEHVNPASPQVDHHLEGSISSGQTVSPVVPPPAATHSTIHTNIEVKVEDESKGQSVQLCEWIKKEEDEDDYEEQLFHCCDYGGEGCEECRVKREIKEEFDESCEAELGGNSVQGCIRVKKEEEDSEGERPRKMSHYVSSGQLVQHFKCVKKEEEDGGEYVMECDCEDCETCRVKMEMKEELDESGETELGGNSAQIVQGVTQVNKEKENGEGERPKKIQRIDRGVGNEPVGSLSSGSNIISINVECIDDQEPTSSTTPTIIQDHIQPSQPVTIPLPTPIVTPTQSSSSTQHVNETPRDELLSGEPMMDNVALVVDVGAEEFDREQVDEDNSTLNPVHTDQDDEEDDETNEQREDTNVGDERQVPAENFVKRIEPADELGNRFECDYRGCGKRMKLKGNLITHIRSHIREKRFKCPVEGCNRLFVTKDQLQAHLNSHTGNRPFVCSWPRCEARFRSNSNLTEHIRTHTGERPFKCDLCDATFTQHNSLVAHRRIHTGDRPFVCTWPDCGEAFFCSGNLKKHSSAHSNERPFVCDAPGCRKAYKRIDALRNHQKAKHN